MKIRSFNPIQDEGVGVAGGKKALRNSFSFVTERRN